MAPESKKRETDTFVTMGYKPAMQSGGAALTTAWSALKGVVDLVASMRNQNQCNQVYNPL